MKNPFFKRLVVKAPADVGTDDLLTVDLESVFGSDCRDADQVDCVEKRDSTGTPKTYDDDVKITGGVLRIEEGTTGFAAGDRWTLHLVAGRGTSVTAESLVDS